MVLLRRRNLGAVLASLLVAVAFLSSVTMSSPSPHPLSSTASAGSVEEAWVSLPGDQLAPSGSLRLGEVGDANIDLAIALPSKDPVGLTAFLANVSAPGNPQYDGFLTVSEFEDRFGSSPTDVRAVEEFLSAHALATGTVYPGGLVIDAEGSARAVGAAFHTSLYRYQTTGGVEVFAPSTPPEVPEALRAAVLGVTGLSNIDHPTSDWAWGQNGYQQGTGQQVFGPDLQVPNGLLPVYNSSTQGSMGRGETIVTILWDGQSCDSGIPVYTGCASWGSETAPFDPAWITQYLNSYLPRWEPRPNIAGVPVDGAVAPGPSADLDASGSIAESALDLEMAGSMAPAANITEVYTTCDPSSSGPQGSTLAQMDDAFATAVTNPNGSPYLKNVTVISNSWGVHGASGQAPVDDPAWVNTLMEANALGITVLASSGDSGDTSVSWPAVIGNDSFGMLAVGGTTINVSGTPAQQSLTKVTYEGHSFPGVYTLPQSNNGSTVARIHSEPAWYGSSGGASQYFSEPSWQEFALQGTPQNPAPMRGMPDIAGVANNTLVEVDIDGATGGLLNEQVLAAVAGTSVASPLDAAVLAVVAGAVGHKLGFVDPTLYSLGYNQSLGKLPAAAFHDVTTGRNSNFSAEPGWDAVTGWGSLNASGLVEDLALYPHISSFEAVPDLVPIGGSTQLNVSAEYGSPPYSYSYSGLPPGCVSSNNSTLPCSPTATGPFDVGVTVTDSKGYIASGSTNFTVGVPAVTAFTATPSSVVLGNSTLIATTAVGASSFSYAGLPPGCPSENLSMFSCTPTVGGDFSLRVYVNNSIGSGSLTTSLAVEVPSISSLDLTPASSTIAVDASQIFSATPGCTFGPCPSTVGYSWSIPSGSGTLNASVGSSVRFDAEGEEGSATLTVTATLYGSTLNRSAEITVVPSLSGVSVSPSSATLGVGEGANFTATPTCVGGSCPFGIAYSWTLTSDAGSAVVGSGGVLRFAAGQIAGNETLSVHATLEGRTANASVAVLIVSPVPPASSAPTLDGLIGGAVVAGLVVVVAVLAVSRRRRRRRSSGR
jgi:Pro-kumamolisin, activation domain